MINQDVLDRWKVINRERGVPDEAWDAEIKLLRDPSSDFVFAAVFNPYRFQRYGALREGECVLCGALDQDNTFFPEGVIPGFTPMPNKFPNVLGVSIAVSNEHRSMYATNNLEDLPAELDAFFRFAEKTGFRVHHQTRGAGATIPEHEHYHINAGSYSSKLGVEYGFGSADFKQVHQDRRVSVMPGFPFAHLIFPLNDPGYVGYFLSQMGGSLGHKFVDNNYEVPHILCQNPRGLLVVPFDNVSDKGIGAGDVEGTLLFGERREFDEVNYQKGISRLAERLPLKSDLNLANLL